MLRTFCTEIKSIEELIIFYLGLQLLIVLVSSTPSTSDCSIITNLKEIEKEKEPSINL